MQLAVSTWVRLKMKTCKTELDLCFLIENKNIFFWKHVVNKDCVLNYATAKFDTGDTKRPLFENDLVGKKFT